MKQISFLLLTFLMTAGYAAENGSERPVNGHWSDTDINPTLKTSLKLMPDQFRLLRLNDQSLVDELSPVTDTSLSRKRTSHSAISKQLTVPLPDGKSLALNLVSSKVMSTELAAKFPQIKTYNVNAEDNNGVYGSIDFGAQGFHAMLFMKDGSRLFIDPRQPDSSSDPFYISYYDKNYHPANKQPFHCQLKTHHHDLDSVVLDSSIIAYRTSKRAGTQLKTYRLAMAATSEYMEYHGGKVAAMSAIVTTVNRVNVIYQRDLAIKLELVANNDQLIQSDISLYDSDDPEKMLEQNQALVDRIIGEDNYDIAHVTSTGEGGIASLASVCEDGNKAQGYTASNNPIGDTFDIDFVAHEMGHQFGGTHTFNAQTDSCEGDNRYADTAFEPGSGSTIMAYAGICGKNDLQDNTDPMFHITSIVQISEFVEKGIGKQCGVNSSLSNRKPVSDAGKDYTIPANTAFELSGSGSDPDKDKLSYSWEQVDSGAASDFDEVEVDNAIFRAFLPVNKPVRVFPKLSSILANTSTKGEKLADIARDLDFSLVVRDGKGGVAADEMRVTVTDSAAFKITSQNTQGTLKAGQSTDISWNVANTNNSPINCEQVDILLSTDADHSFATVLASKTANDGAETVKIPVNVDQTKVARVKVKCSNNIFFDISDADLKIKSLLNALTPVISNLGDNQVVDPGETIQLTIPLQNAGSQLITSISGLLSSTGKGVKIQQKNSLYNDLQAGAKGDNLTGFELTVPANYSCGVNIPVTFKSNFTLASVNNKTFEFSIPTGISAKKSKEEQVLLDIPDNKPTGLTSQIVLSNAVVISEDNFSIDVDIDHTYQGDLILTLVSPQGSSILLKQTSVANNSRDLKGNFPQTFEPHESLKVFNGENPNGIWTLKVADAGKGDRGKLNSWGIHYATASCSVISNVVPEATNNELTTESGQVLTAQLQAHDANGDVITYQLVSNASKGIVSIINPSTGKFSYTPKKGEEGKDSFTFLASDASGKSNIAKVTIIIKPPVPVNTIPVARNSLLKVNQDESKSGTLLASDRDNNALVYSLVTKSTKGSVKITNAATGAYIYTPNKGVTGEDAFTFKVFDGTKSSNVATVTVIISKIIVANNLANNPSETSERGGGGSLSWSFLSYLLLIVLFIKRRALYLF